MLALLTLLPLTWLSIMLLVTPIWKLETLLLLALEQPQLLLTLMDP